MHTIFITNIGCECSCGFSKISVAGGEAARAAYLHARSGRREDEEVTIIDQRTRTETKTMPLKGRGTPIRTFGQIVGRQG